MAFATRHDELTRFKNMKGYFYELVLNGNTLTGTELGYLDGLTPGTVTLSKGVVVDANKDISAFRNVGVVNLDAGSSGVAGTVDIFPTTASKGKLAITFTANTNDDTTTIVNAAQSGAWTYTIPDAGASTSFVMLAGNQTLSGIKTFSAKPVVTIDDASNNAVTDILLVNHTTSGSPAAGIGAGLAFGVEDAGGLEEQGRIDVVGTVVTDSAEDFDMVFKTNVAGTITTMARIVADETGSGGAKLVQIGADANAVSLDLHPATTASGTLRLTAANSAGDTVTTITNASQAAARTYTIPDAGTTNASFVMTEGAQTIVGAKTFSAAIVPTGGVGAAGGFTHRPSNIHTGGYPARLSTDGTDVTPSVSEMYYAAVQIPGNMTVTGVSVFLGTATEGNMKVGLFNSAGVNVATSASTDISGMTADTYNRIAFTGTYAAVGPATYYVGIMQDNTGNRFNAHLFGDFPASKTTGETYATGFTTISSPATTFTASLGPYASLY